MKSSPCFFCLPAEKKSRKERKERRVFIILPYSTLALKESQTLLRQESAESLSTPSPLRGTPACLRGRTDPLNPPETGATRSEATEGVDSFPF